MGDATAEWIRLGRHDWSALLHGINDLREVGGWSLLLAAYLSGPGPLPAADVDLVDISRLESARWRTLKERLLRLRRIEVRGANLHIPFLDEKLAMAAKAINKGRSMAKDRWGHGDA